MSRKRATNYTQKVSVTLKGGKEYGGGVGETIRSVVGRLRADTKKPSKSNLMRKRGDYKRFNKGEHQPSKNPEENNLKTEKRLSRKRRI